MCGNRPPKNLDVAVLNMPPVAPQMNGNSLRAGELADGRRGDGIGLVGLAGLLDRGDVIDVDCQMHAIRVTVNSKQLTVNRESSTLLSVNCSLLTNALSIRKYREIVRSARRLARRDLAAQSWREGRPRRTQWRRENDAVQAPAARGRSRSRRDHPRFGTDDRPRQPTSGRGAGNDAVRLRR